MIKILKEGKIPAIEIECPYCHSELSYNPCVDLQYTKKFRYGYFDGLIDCPYIYCPHCKAKIFTDDDFFSSLFN